jgi:hypothetical protein
MGKSKTLATKMIKWKNRREAKKKRSTETRDASDSPDADLALGPM